MLSHGTRPFEETYQLPSARSSDQLQEHIHVFSVRRQRERYARALEKLRKEIREGALRLLISQTSFIILGQDENTPPVSDALAMAAAMLEDAGQNGSLANAEKVLLETYSSDGYLQAVRPLIEKIRYVAYAPYWASRSSLDEETGQYTNAIISHLHSEKMVYQENTGVWYATRTGFCFWDLPPTMPGIRREYILVVLHGCEFYDYEMTNKTMFYGCTT